MKDLISVAIETSGRYGSVVIGKGTEILLEKPFSGAMRHSSELLPTIEDMTNQLNLKPNNISNVLVSIGPGSFTGLRIAVSVAKMMNLANNTKIFAVNTMDILSRNADDYCRDNSAFCNQIAIILDAKRKKFFISLYERKEDNWVKKVPDELLISADEFLGMVSQQEETTYLLGEGLHYYSNLFTSDNTIILPGQYWPAQARNLYRIGLKKIEVDDFSDPDTLIPNYIRSPEAVSKWDKL